MRNLLALCLAALAFDATAQTRIDEQSLQVAARLRDKAMASTPAYEVLESLTTEVGSRMAGTPGDARAVEWAQRAFKSLGFDKVYTEPVTFPVWERRRESAEITAPFPHQLHVTALGGSSGTGRRAIEAEVVEFATLDALKQARAEDVKDKIVYIGNRMRRAKDGAGYGEAVRARVEGATVAARLGARAILIRSIGTDSHRLPHTGLAVSRDAVLRDKEQADKLERTRSGLPIVTTPIPAGAVSNPDADLLGHVLERGQPVRIKLLLDVGYSGEYTSANVIGEITGSEKPDEVIVIGAHLDSWDLGTGAIDDGAGVAITMAVGNMLKMNNVVPRRTIRVVAFANEEQGLYGGRAYAEKHGGDIAKQVIGAESDFGAGRIYAVRFGVAEHAQDAAKQIAEVLAPIGIAADGAKGGAGPDLQHSVARGMAWAQLAQDGTDYFDVHHTADDTLDKVDSDNLDQNVAAYTVFAYLAAQAEGDFGSAPKAPAAP